jgi:large subunit ribosomal protein L21
MYVLMEIQGKQYRAEKGSRLTVDLLSAQKGETVELGNVLLASGENGVKIGAPYVEGVKVKATVEDQVKGDKVRIYKYKRRKGYKREAGHREKYVVIKVEDISGV